MQFKHIRPLSEMEVCHVLKMQVLTLKAKGVPAESSLLFLQRGVQRSIRTDTSSTRSPANPLI